MQNGESQSAVRENSRTARPEGSPYAAHVPALDGIRGLAVLGVMSSHFFVGTPNGALMQTVRFGLAYGANGVDVFFVLSGFLITGILFDSLSDPNFFRKFYARRILRIFPLYYGVLLCMLATVIFLGKQYHGQLLSLALYMQNTSVIAPAIWTYHGASLLPLAHFWTLAVEEQFYLVWPLAVFFLRKRKSILVVSLIAVVLSPVIRLVLLQHGFLYPEVNEATYCRLDSLLGGAALAMLLRGPWHDRLMSRATWIFLVGVLLETATKLGVFRSDRLDEALHYTALSLASAGLLLLALRPGKLRKVFSAVQLRWLGKYSYGIYVLHLILFDLFFTKTHVFLLEHVSSNKALDLVILAAGFGVVSCLAGYLSYQLYEKHFLRLKRYFEYRPRGEKAATQG